MAVLTGRAAILLLTVPGLEAYDYFDSGASCAAAGCAALDSSQCSSIAKYKRSESKSDRPPDCYRQSNGKLYFNTNSNPTGCTTSRECVCSCPFTCLRITTGTGAQDDGTLDEMSNVISLLFHELLRQNIIPLGISLRMRISLFIGGDFLH